MTTTKAARAALAISILIYGGAFAAVLLELIDPAAGMLTSLAAMAGMAISSVICLALGARRLFRSSR